MILRYLCVTFKRKKILLLFSINPSLFYIFSKTSNFPVKCWKMNTIINSKLPFHMIHLNLFQSWWINSAFKCGFDDCFEASPLIFFSSNLKIKMAKILKFNLLLLSLLIIVPNLNANLNFLKRRELDYWNFKKFFDLNNLLVVKKCTTTTF